MNNYLSNVSSIIAKFNNIISIRSEKRSVVTTNQPPLPQFFFIFFLTFDVFKGQVKTVQTVLPWRKVNQSIPKHDCFPFLYFFSFFFFYWITIFSCINQIESASIKKSCLNVNPEKSFFGFNIRFISRSLKNGCLQLHMCAVKPKILFVNFEVIFKIQHSSIYWQKSTYKDPRYALIFFISNFHQLSCVIVSP